MYSMTDSVKTTTVVNSNMAVIKTRKSVVPNDVFKEDVVENKKTAGNVNRTYVTMDIKNNIFNRKNKNSDLDRNPLTYEEMIYSVNKKNEILKEKKIDLEIELKEDEKSGFLIEIRSANKYKKEMQDFFDKGRSMVYDKRTIIYRIPNEDMNRFFYRLEETVGSIIDEYL